ncbi:hypothetical protein DIPPA_10307 [Diplonema papillatum]|nr:hypothetical protein DIPPA_10307 [Diplonema papillatum]
MERSDVRVRSMSHGLAAEGEASHHPDPAAPAAHGPAAEAPPSPPAKKTQRRMSLLDMMGLFSMSFFYGLIYNSLVTLVIPTEVQRLTQHKQSVWISLMTGGGAISQLSSPIVGAWSDRVHKRVSFIVHGSFVSIVGISCFLVVSATNSMFLLFLSHITTMVGLSIVYSMISALLNDCILPEQTGTGSGTVAILGTLGSGCGYAMFVAGIPIEYTYCLYILTCLLCLGICVLYVPSNLDTLLCQAALKVRRKAVVTKQSKETSALSQSFGPDEPAPGAAPEQPAEAGDPRDVVDVEADGVAPQPFADTDAVFLERLLSKDKLPSEKGFTTELLLEAITMPSPSRYPDFTCACLSRLLFNSGLAAQVYMSFFFRDVVHVQDNPTHMVSVVAVMSLVGCTLAALPAGIMSDRVGKKPVIYVGLCICVSAIILFLVTSTKNQFLLLGLVPHRRTRLVGHESISVGWVAQSDLPATRCR